MKRVNGIRRGLNGDEEIRNSLTIDERTPCMYGIRKKSNEGNKTK